MNKHIVLITNPGRDLAFALPRLQRAAISTKSCHFLKLIFLGTPVTFLFWHTYFSFKLTLQGESNWAAEDLWRNNQFTTIAEKGINDE